MTKIINFAFRKIPIYESVTNSFPNNSNIVQTHTLQQFDVIDCELQIISFLNSTELKPLPHTLHTLHTSYFSGKINTKTKVTIMMNYHKFHIVPTWTTYVNNERIVIKLKYPHSSKIGKHLCKYSNYLC